jgi:teichuronic acid biosynthesis glycosyltransferase TuaG
MECNKTENVADQTNQIDVIMPLFNCEKYVGEAIESVIKQTYKDWRLIIIDDCSTDKSFQVAGEYASKDPRITLIKNEHNSGTAKSRNEGLKRADGHYVAFLDADDCWDPNFLSEQLAFIQEKGSAVVTAGYRRKTEKSCTEFVPPLSITATSILGGNPISCLSTLYDREKAKDIYFDETLKRVEDLLFWYNILSKSGAALGNQKVLATYRILGNSKSRKKIKLIKWQWRIYRKIGFGFFKSLHYLNKWALNGIKKYRKVK